MASAGRSVKKEELCALLVWNVNQYSTMENSLEFFKELKELPYDPAITWVYIQRK
jgi:hypothetical protein